MPKNGYICQYILHICIAVSSTKSTQLNFCPYPITYRNKKNNPSFQDMQDHEHERSNLTGLAEQLCFITRVLFYLRFCHNILRVGSLSTYRSNKTYHTPYQHAASGSSSHKTGDSITHLHIQDIPLLTDQIYQRSEISKLYPSTVICS